MSASDGITYLPSWANATDPSDDPSRAPTEAPPLRTCDADGSVHFSQLKKIAWSGVQYLHACNVDVEPTRDMLVGTVSHFLLFGARPGGKAIVRHDGRRAGKEWTAFEAAHAGAEIVTASEWDDAERLAEAVRSSPVAMARLTGARFEVPLVWEESGVKCSTSGVDIVCAADDLGDLKTTFTTEPRKFMRQAFGMSYPQQLAFYRRGARANGIKPRTLFLLGVERRAPHEVVELDLTEAMVDFADRSVTLWLEKLRGLRSACPEPRRLQDWPGYAQSPVLFDVPAWAAEDEDDGDDLDLSGASEEAAQ